MIPEGRIPKRLLGLVLGAAFCWAVPAAGDILPQWTRVEIPATGSYFWRYVPESLDQSKEAPVVLFFHGAGTIPDAYRNFITSSAERAGTVVAMPKSSGVGWGTVADELTVTETLRLVREELKVDARRIGLAGHSAGGAWAYLVAYAGKEYSAVFTLGTPFYAVDKVVDPAYKPPIHMYYGTTDLNYTAARPQLIAQWDRLGIPWEEDIQPSFGHNSWPNSSMAAGFLFLAGHSRPSTGGPCVPGDTSLCLGHGRFRAEVAWDTGTAAGPGHVVPGAAGGSGLFWFFSADNWELLVKLIDGCPVNNRFWVFSSATTNVRYILTVTDLATGQTARYENLAGKPAAAVTDTEAFATCP